MKNNEEHDVADDYENINYLKTKIAELELKKVKTTNPKTLNILNKTLDTFKMYLNYLEEDMKNTGNFGGTMETEKINKLDENATKYFENLEKNNLVKNKIYIKSIIHNNIVNNVNVAEDEIISDEFKIQLEDDFGIYNIIIEPTYNGFTNLEMYFEKHNSIYAETISDFGNLHESIGNEEIKFTFENIKKLIKTTFHFDEEAFNNFNHIDNEKCVDNILKLMYSNENTENLGR